mmetsp:Transcript_11862/g.18199  ORF Transcript_11862/g.18199 Transcript_11862/m.18199 type:complete len:208 (+) Transcript_11862:84-707(+)
MSNINKIVHPNGRTASLKAIDSFIDESADVVPDDVIIEFLEHLNDFDQTEKRKDASSVTPLSTSSESVESNDRSSFISKDSVVEQADALINDRSSFISRDSVVDQADALIDPSLVTPLSALSEPRTTVVEEGDGDEQVCYVNATLVTTTDQPAANFIEAAAINEPDVGFIVTAKPLTWIERRLWRITVVSLSINVVTILYIIFKLQI